MSKYVERNLNNGEEVILQAKKSIWVLIPAILLILVCLIAAIIVQIVLLDEYDFPPQACAFVWCTLLIPSIGYFIWKFLKWYSMVLCVTNKRVVGKIGVLSIHSLDFMISKVDNVSIQAGVLGNIFKYHTVIVRGGGDVEVVTRRRNKNKNAFIGISNAREFKNIVTQAVEQHAAEARKAQAEEIARAMSQKTPE